MSSSARAVHSLLWFWLYSVTNFQVFISYSNEKSLVDSENWAGEDVRSSATEHNASKYIKPEKVLKQNEGEKVQENNLSSKIYFSIIFERRMWRKDVFLQLRETCWYVPSWKNIKTYEKIVVSCEDYLIGEIKLQGTLNMICIQ